MPRLIVVSNRVPSFTEEERAGGLAVTLKAALRKTGGTWLGWSGDIVDEVAPRPKFIQADRFDLAAIDLSPAEFRGYYENHANRGLWPLFHGRLDLASFDYDSYALYRAVNRRFASAVASLVHDDDMVWVHDYQLIPLAAELRRLGVTAPIGFFLHIPFPPAEILAALPWARELLEEMSAYDLIGFQTSDYERNFKDALDGEFLAASDRPDIGASRVINTGHFPISIDTRAFASLSTAPQTQRRVDRLNACRQDRKWAVGVERLDYTKGLPERFLAMEKLFEQSPTLVGQFSLMQVAAPSRDTVAEYQDLKGELEALSGRINARLGGFDWTPIHYLNRTFNHTHLAALYRVSQICLVTPLRDGMNLVAKEYIAAQDAADPGVLVLSRFAGAAAEMTDALQVNPHDPVDIARALQQALEMPVDERRARWNRMMRHLERHDVHHWCDHFLKALAASRFQVPITTAVA